MLGSLRSSTGSSEDKPDKHIERTCFLESGHLRSVFAFDLKEDFLGKEGDGLVYRCKHKFDKMVYRVKVSNLEEEEEKKRREVELMATLEHSNVVRYHGSWIEEGCINADSDPDRDGNIKPSRLLGIQMQYYPRLKQELSKGQPTVETARKWFSQVMMGLEYIHSEQVIHCNLSSQSVLLDSDSDAAIADLSLALEFENKDPIELEHSAVLGDAYYSSPDKFVSTALDIYSAGLLLIELLHQFSTDDERVKAFEELKKGTFPNELQLGIFDQLVRRMVSSNPRHRPSASHVLEYLEEIKPNAKRGDHV